MAPITYTKDFIQNPEEVFAELAALEWEQRDAPRMEYYINDSFPEPYIYGSGRGRREYKPRFRPKCVAAMQMDLMVLTGHWLLACFLNRYRDQKDQLGWHADDSPEMDDNKPIAIVSLGVPREIWFRKKGDSADKVEKLLLESGSLCLMSPGMQDTHQHRIPKADRLVGERISLTFRGYLPQDLPKGA